MSTQNLKSLLRSRTRHVPPPELDARVRNMIAAHPPHTATPYVPGPFTWRDWFQVALAFSGVAVAIVAFLITMPSTTSSSKQPYTAQRQDDWATACFTDAAWTNRTMRFYTYRLLVADAEPPGS